MKYIHRLLLLGFASLFAVSTSAQQACPVTPKRGGECWTTEDVIDGHIDHHAQSAMLWMFARGGQAAADASALLCAVKTQQLEGIYLPDQGVPALRAQSVGSGWWLMIPQGRLSTCYKQPPNRAPLITFRKQIKDNKDYVANALGQAWGECGIPPTAPRCYIATISKPEPVECRTDEDCYKLHPDDKTTAWTCEQNMCRPIDWPPPIVEKCEYPRCDPNVDADVWAACGYHEAGAIKCNPTGEECGVCDRVSPESKKCHDDNRARKRQEYAKCRAEHSPGKTAKYGIDCAKEAVKCEGGSATACAKFAKCFVSPEPYNQYRKCLDDATRRWDIESKRCSKL